MLPLHLVLNLDQDFTVIQEMTSEIHHYLRTPVSIITSSSYLLQVALSPNQNVSKSPSKYIALMQDAAQCLETSCRRMITRMNQANFDSWALNRIRFYLDKIIYFCQTVLGNLETISHSNYHHKLMDETEKSEIINLLVGLNQWSMQMTDVLSSDSFNNYVEKFSEGLFIRSRFNDFEDYQSV
jgi:signal transduction histidine kinase